MFGLFKAKKPAQAATPSLSNIQPRRDVSLGRMFCQNGFVHLPGVFGREEIRAFRRACIGAVPVAKPPYQPQFSNSALFGEPFRPIFRNGRLTESLRSLLGDDFLFLNEFSLQDSHFSGWHTDTTSPEAKAGHEFHWSPTFLVVNVAVYLQDNDGNGGGLDIVPGSHVRDDPLAITMQGGQVSDPYASAKTVDGRAGDVVIFHLRVSHRSSIPVRNARNDLERKLALFMIAGQNNAMTRRYREWLVQYDVMNGVKRPLVPADFLSFLVDARLEIL
jgi:hypothetical protein